MQVNEDAHLWKWRWFLSHSVVSFHCSLLDGMTFSTVLHVRLHPASLWQQNGLETIVYLSTHLYHLNRTRSYLIPLQFTPCAFHSHLLPSPSISLLPQYLLESPTVNVLSSSCVLLHSALPSSLLFQPSSSAQSPKIIPPSPNFTHQHSIAENGSLPTLL